MARLLTAGFETGTLQELNGAQYGVSAPSTVAKRTGSYALALMGGEIVAGTSYVTHAFNADYFEMFFRFSWQLDSTGIMGHPYLAFRDADGENLLTLEFDGSSQDFKLYRGNPSFVSTPGTLLATGSIVIRAGIAYLLEGHIKINASAGEFILKINAVTDISYAGNTGTAGVRSLKVFGPLGGVSGYLYIDDIAFNDPSGSFENSYPGLGGVFFLKANGDGATNEWPPSTGVDHYAVVDEVPANTTDYVMGTDAGDLQLYEIEDTPPYVTAINVVQPVFQVALEVSGSNEIRDVVRAETVDYSGSITHTVVSIAPGFVLYRGETYYEQPDGVSGAFEVAALDALQVGFEIPT
jgi:hypothetical protein